MNSEEHDRLGLAIQLKYIQIEGRFFGKFNLGLLPTEPDLSQASCQVAYHDSYSVTTPTTANGRLIFGIFAALAEFEAELIRERTKAGLAAARARGRLGGRPREITIETLKMAMAAMEDPKTKASEVANRLGITTTTLYTCKW